jgi:hypothetical protein
VESPSSYVTRTMRTNPPEIRERGRQLLDAWAERYQATPYTGRGKRCLRKLVNPRHHCGRSCFQAGLAHHFQALDHAEWWKDAGGRFIVTAHPYAYQDDDMEKLRRFCEREGLTFEVGGTRESWYIPGRTYLLTLRGPGAL